MSQPDFDKLECKHDSRERLIWAYRREYGRNSIPRNKQYWSMCGIQTNSNKSEINQLTSCGLIKASQFHGVDFDSIKIENNKISHPKAKWYTGDWVNVLENNIKDFYPEIINLDTMCVAGKVPSLRLLSNTMELCPPGTFLAFNVISANPHDSRDRISDSSFKKLLNKNLNINQINMWKPLETVIRYSSTGLTLMSMYFFIKRSL